MSPSRLPRPPRHQNPHKENNSIQANKANPEMLTKQYADRLQRMQERLDKEISKNTIVKDAVKIPLRVEKVEETLEEKLNKDFDKAQRIKNKSVGIEMDLIPEKQEKPKYDTYSFVRSNQSIQHRIKEGFTDNIMQKKSEDMQLVQKLNRHMVELDKMNEEKRILNQELLEKIKFVRSLQGQLGTADNGDINDMIDKELENEFKKEKHMNLQLKEKLKECEMEKLQIIEQLKLMEAKHDVVVVTVDDNNVELDRALMNVNEMIDYRQKILRDIEVIENELRKLHHDEDANQRLIYDLEKQVGVMRTDRNKYAEERIVIQKQVDSSSSTIVRDKQNLHQELKRHRGMLAGIVLAGSIDKGLQRFKKHFFSEFLYKMYISENQIKSIIAFRDITLKFEEKRKYKYFSNWVKNVMKPVRLLKINQELTEFMLKRELQKQMFTIWNQQLITKNKIENRQMQKIANSFHRLISFNNRSIKYHFVLWKLKTKIHDRARKKLLNFVKERVYYKARQAFLRWHNLIIYTDQIARINSLGVRGSVLNYKQALFYGWRNAVCRIKNSKFNLKVRVWNKLVKYTQLKKQKKYMVQLAIRFSNTYKKNFMHRHMEHMKRILKNNMYERDLANLKMTNIQITLLEEHVDALSRKQNKKGKKTKTQFIRDCLNKRIGEAFYHWRNLCINDHKRIFKVCQVKMVKVYHRILRAYFIKWNKVKVKKMKKTKIMQMTEISSSTMDTQDEISNTTQKTQAVAVRSNNQGKSRYKKVLYFTYLKVMKSRFDQWNTVIKNMNKIENGLEHVLITKMKRRILRQYFKLYVEKTKMMRQEAHNEIRGDFFNGVMIHIVKKRMFNAIKKYTNNFRISRKFLRKVIHNTDIGKKKQAFEWWKSNHSTDKFDEFTNTQNFMVNEVQDKQEESGSLQNENLFMKNKIKELEDNCQNLSRKSLAKTIAQFGRYRQYAAFIKWREHLAEHKNASHNIQRAIIQRILHRQLHGAFQTWRQNHTRKKKKMKQMMVEQEMAHQKMEEENIEKVRQIGSENKEVRSANLSVTQSKQKYSAQKCMNVIDKIIENKNNYFSLPIQENIFKQWKNYIYDKKKATRRIAELMDKNAAQVGFDCIRELNWESRVLNKKRYVVNRFFQYFKKKSVNHAFHVWKEQIFTNAKQKTDKLSTIIYHHNKNEEIMRTNKQDHIVDSMCAVLKSNIKKNCLIALFDYKCQRQYKRLQHERMVDKLLGLRGKKAVQLWRQRAIKTIHCKRLIYNYKEANRIRIFTKGYQVFKQNWTLKRLIVTRLLNAERAINLELKREAWRGLQQEKKLNQVQQLCGYARAEIIQKGLIERHEEQRFFVAFKRLQSNAKILSFKHKFLAKVVKNRWAHEMRYIFQKWKKESDRLTLAKYENELGRTRMEWFKIERDNKNLKDLLKQDGFTDKQIAQIIEDDDKKYLNIVEKALCRLYLQNPKSKKIGMHLVPYCFDKLKQYKKERYVYKYAINKINHIIDKKITERDVFIIWMNYTWGRHQELNGVQYKNLDKIDQKNDRGKQQVIGEMEEKYEEITEVKQQRTFLISKVIVAQRLALARCHQSYMMAKEKAFNKFYMNTVCAYRRDFNHNQGQNLDNIDYHKNRMLKLQEQNEILDIENDQLRKKAGESTGFMKDAELLTQQIEALTSELGDKQSQIRDLVERNKQLQSQLRQYEQNSMNDDLNDVDEV